MFNLREFEKKINGIETRRNVPMAQRTSFHVGGNADLVIFPASEMELQRVLRLLSAERTPYFVLGGGTNLIVADKGIREPVIATEKLKRIAVDGCRITAEAGARVEDVCLAALNAGLSGLEFLYKLPGSVGGAVRMNARCYERSAAEVIESVRYLKGDGSPHTLSPADGGFGYKRSPFQDNASVVVSAVFRLEPGDRRQIEEAMNAAESSIEGEADGTPCHKRSAESVPSSPMPPWQQLRATSKGVLLRNKPFRSRAAPLSPTTG